MYIYPISKYVVDFFRPASYKEKMDQLQGKNLSLRIEDSMNTWGKWTRVIYNTKTHKIEASKGQPLTSKDLIFLSAHFEHGKKK